jgi:hypothetical protein
MEAQVEGYTLTSQCRCRADGRYSVAVIIGKMVEGQARHARFDDTGISLILKAEAEKEALNFGRNLIGRRMVGF